MIHRAQDEFRQRIKVWLIRSNLTVTALAGRIGRRRDTVSKAINSGRFPKIRQRIREELSR
jgi:IS30 family transposase